jgi:hypothetical protein
MTLYDRAKFKHGGLLHQDADMNNMLAMHPQLAKVLLRGRPVRYEVWTQRYWLILYHNINRIYGTIDNIIDNIKRYKYNRHHRKINRALKDTRKQLGM